MLAERMKMHRPSRSWWRTCARAADRPLAEPDDARLQSDFGVTQTSTGAMNLPGAGLPTSTRSAVTRSPVSRLNVAHGLGIRPKVIFWMGWPVAVFMIVAMIAMPRR
jgi:hypothetical protein